MVKGLLEAARGAAQWLQQGRLFGSLDAVHSGPGLEHLLVYLYGCQHVLRMLHIPVWSAALHWEDYSCAAGMVLAGQPWAEAQAALAAGMAACLEALDPMRLEQGIAQPGGTTKGSQSQAPHLLPEAAVERFAAQLADPTPGVPAPGPGHMWMGEQQKHSQDLLSSKVTCLVDCLLSRKVRSSPSSSS